MIGLLDDTPLGRIVSIRAEKDQKRINRFTKEEHEIHDRWKQKQNEKIINVMSDSKKKEMTESFHTFIKQLFGKGGA